METNPLTKIKVLMASAEAAPFVKVGGLGDVAGSLPMALERLGVDARVILPLYGTIDRQKWGLRKIYDRLEVPSGNIFRRIDIYEAVFPGSRVKAYFIENEEMFGAKKIYRPLGQDEERFLFFSLALLYSLPALDFAPQIIHCHDSHTALIPDLVKASNLEYVRRLKTLYTIHNFHYQGISETGVLSTGNLRPESLGSLRRDCLDGDVNFMVQGILNADHINTVSKTYAREITTSAHGAGLERIIRERRADFSGILNGLDIERFNPETDPHLVKNYSILSLDNKPYNKIALQKAFGLPTDERTPVCALVSRLVWQKGLDLFTEDFAKLGAQFVFLGSGAEKYRNHLLSLQEKYPEFFQVRFNFDEGLASRIYAGADIFMMPSRFEPCGLGQMIAMRYGTVPVVRATGGLLDTVDKTVGYTFKKFSSPALYAALSHAIDAYQHMPKTWRHLQERGMKRDFSWGKSAGEYLMVYEKILFNLSSRSRGLGREIPSMFLMKKRFV